MIFCSFVFLLFSCYAQASENPKVGDFLPPESENLLRLLGNDLKSGDLVVVQEAGGWKYVRFFERFGEGESAHVAIANENSRGYLVQACVLRSFSAAAE